MVQPTSRYLNMVVLKPVQQGAELDDVEEDGDLRPRLIFKVCQLRVRLVLIKPRQKLDKDFSSNSN